MSRRSALSAFLVQHFYHAVKKSEQKKARASKGKTATQKNCAGKESSYVARGAAEKIIACRTTSTCNGHATARASA